MNFIKLIKYYYLFLTLLTIIIPINYSLFDLFPGLILMWIVYLLFDFILNYNLSTSESLISPINNSNNWLCVLVTILYLIFYPIYTKFYTGNSMFSSLFSISDGISNYASYQQYFEENSLNEFSLSKLPYIFLHAILKLGFYFLVIRIIVFQEKKYFWEYCCIFIMSVIYILVGISRGTSFEIFEICNLFLFVFVIVRWKNGKATLISTKNAVYLAIIFVACVSYFIFNIKQRYGGDFDFSSLPGYNNKAILSKLFPTISILLFSLYGYFVFGLHYTSILINKLWLDSIIGFSSIFIPDGILKLNISDSTRDFVDRYIDVGAQWTPETVGIIEHFGVVFFILLIFVLGILTRKILSIAKSEILAIVILFYIYLFFVSLPIGNFLTVSSSNKISLFLALIIVLFKRVKFVNGD